MDNAINMQRPARERNLLMKAVTAAATLTNQDLIVNITTNGAYTITLPPVAECAGAILAIFQTGSGTSTVTIAHAGDSLGWTNQITNAAGEAVVLFSTGIMWVVLKGQTS